MELGFGFFKEERKALGHVCSVFAKILHANPPFINLAIYTERAYNKKFGFENSSKKGLVLN